MKRLAAVTTLLGATFACTGCGYMEDRGRDAMDIFTFTIGKGTGATARVGLVHSGFYIGDDYWGLKGGEFRGRWHHEGYQRGFTRDTLDVPFMMPLFFWGQDRFDGTESIAVDEDREVRLSLLRGKRYYLMGMLPVIYTHVSPDEYGYPHESYTQLELAVGIGYTVRAGFNVGELADFVLGWFGIDIYGDDVSTMSKEEIARWAEPRLPEFSWDTLTRGVFTLRELSDSPPEAASYRRPSTRKPKGFEDKYSQFERVSRNGKLFLGCTHKGRVEIWDMPSDRKLFAWDDFVSNNPNLKGDISPDGWRVAVGDDDKILVWDVKSGKQVAAYHPRNGLRGFLSAGQAWYALCSPRNQDDEMLINLGTGMVTHLKRPPNKKDTTGYLGSIGVRPDGKYVVALYRQKLDNAPEGEPKDVYWLRTYELASSKLVGMLRLPPQLVRWWMDSSGQFLRLRRTAGLSTECWQIVPVEPKPASKKPEPTTGNGAEQ